MTNDNVQTMIERYRRELMEFNKRNPQKMMGLSPLTESKAMAVEAVMAERDEMNKSIPAPQANVSQGRILERAKDEDEDRTASEYERSKLFIELNASDNNADGSDNDHKMLDRILPETGLTRLEMQSVMTMAEPAPMEPIVVEQITGTATPTPTPPVVPTTPILPTPPVLQTPTAIPTPPVLPTPTPTPTEKEGTGSALFAKYAREYPPYSSGSAKSYKSLEEFLKENTKTGSLRVQVAAAEQSFPVSNAEVVVTKDFSGIPHVFYKVYTDISGVATGMTLAAPDKALSSYPSVLAPYATYDVTVSHPRYVTVIQRSCAIFDGIETIQFCEMVPKVSSTEQFTVFEEQPKTR